MSKKSKPIQHRAPTPATLKELYANAYCCASPGCSKPLYRIDNESGIRTLNSNASHICARSEGGPRWDRNQSEAENRSINNLLALCLEHADEVDNPKKINQYTVKRLREWKKKQLSEFDTLGKQGWSLRNEDIKKLNKHFNTIKTIINNSIIDLGGKGGSAPGAGGGGGGVLGSLHSQGGGGGNGGKTILLNGREGTAPGVGGGGAGTLGDGAIAPGGGSAGDIVKLILRTDSFDSFEYQVGEGGEEGKDGDDTIIKLIKDGKVTKTIEAKGGKAGEPGKHGDLSTYARTLTKEELKTGIGISTILFTDVFHFKNGLVTLLNAGWELFKVPSLPYHLEWPIFLIFSVVGLNAPAVISFSITVRDSEKNLLYEQQNTFSKLCNDAFRIPWMQVLKFEVKKEGLLTVDVLSGDSIIATLPINLSVS